MNKACPKCSTIKSTDSFYKNASTKSGLSGWCKVCQSQKISEWKAAHRARIRITENARREVTREHQRELARLRYSRPRRRQTLLKRYGLTEEDYLTILEAQAFACGICGRSQEEFSYPLHVDHNHITDKTRGLLCLSCNTSIGSLKLDSSPERLYAALEYYETHKDRR